jgi:hypothetical protein
MTLSIKGASVVAARSLEQLEPHREAIEHLAAHAVDPNPFYEPWFMLPLLRIFGRRQRLCMLLVYSTATADLLGFFPFEWTLLHRRLPLTCLRLWRDPEHWAATRRGSPASPSDRPWGPWVQRSTPLVRDGALADCIAAVLGWMASDPEAPRLIDLPNVPATTAVAQALAAGLAADGGLRHVVLDGESHLYRRQIDAETYLARILDGDRRRNLQRRARRLAELGPVAYVDVDDPQEGGRLIDDFVVLEAGGWKGGNGTAMASCDGGAEVAEAVLHEAWRRGRLSLLGLRVGGRLVAGRSIILAPPGGFGFKIAYDESEAIARCSPGYLLEMEGLRRFHDDTTRLGAGMRWLDTCADAGAALARATRWESLSISRTIVARRGSAAEGVVALLPRLVATKATLRSNLGTIKT